MIGHTRGAALESDILNFKTLLHKFTSISTMFPNFRRIRPVVIEISARQNLSRKKEEEKEDKKKMNKKRSKNGNSPPLRLRDLIRSSRDEECSVKCVFS